ncbi:hypothetical protein COU59_01220 [Candidatus Pacearchaeota archaeon CG10_big_fil_rev_8_21_14_0_10_34_12]|nr:MAG: hypothetical protein COU59_01220 [Candidatus Pacearchaeota archaeon CG10_big_fil_rev_8_21_14_0_10_34_12]
MPFDGSTFFGGERDTKPYLRYYNISDKINIGGTLGYVVTFNILDTAGQTRRESFVGDEDIIKKECLVKVLRVRGFNPEERKFSVSVRNLLEHGYSTIEVYSSEIFWR